MHIKYAKIHELQGEKFGTHEAKQFSSAFPIFTMTTFLENLGDADIRDRFFFDSIGKSKFSRLKLILIDGSYTKSYE